MIGGKRNSNVVASMLTNFDVAENVVKTAAEASGSALAENAKQLESINGKLTKMKAAFDALALSVVNDDFTKGIIDGITALLELLHDLIEAFGGVGNALLVVGNIAAGLKFKDFSEYIQKAVNAFKVWNGTLIDVTGGASQAGKAMGNMGEAAAKAAEHTSGAATAMSKAGDGAIAVSRGVKAASVSIMAVTAVISIAISAYQAWKRNIEEQAEAAAESAREYRESANSLEAYQKQITELNDKLKYGNLSQEEAYEVRKNLLSIQDEIRDAYGKEAEAIDLVRMSADEANESIDALKKTQAEEHLLKNGTAISRSIRKIETEKDWLNATLGVGNASEAEIASLEEALKQYENVFFDRRKVGKNAFFDIRVNANAIEAKEVIQSLSADLDSLQESAGNISLAGLELALPAAYEKIESLFDTHYEAYEGAILPKIVDNSEYDRVYNLITDAQDAFANLQTAGYDDAERRVDSAKALLDTVTTVAAELEKVPFKAEDNAVRNYLFELLERLQKDLDREALYVDLVVGAPEGDRKKRFAQKQIQNALDVFRREDGQVYEVDIQNAGLTASAPAEAMDSGNYDVAGELSEQEVAWISLRNAAAEYNLEVEELISLLITKGDVMQEVTQSVQEQTASIDGLSESITNLKGTYDLLATAQEEMASEKGGLSAETIQAVMEAEKNYLDYLYEENGVIKLNTDAWRTRGEAAADIDTRGLYSEIEALSERNAVLIDSIDEQRRAMENVPESSVEYEVVASDLDMMTKELYQNSEAIDENTRKLKLYSGVMATIRPTEWDSTKFTFDASVSKLQAVGTLQKELANGYTITAQKARELADVYPEILAQATTSTDGQITLNQEVVSAFINGKTEEVNTAIDGEISKLEAKRSLLEAELAIVRKQIAVAQGGDQAAVDSANEAAGAEIGIMQTVLAAAEQAGIDETTANQLALQAMSGDWGAFADTAIAAIGGLDTESAGIFTSVMSNFAKTSQNMIHNSNEMILAFNRLGTAFRASMNPDGTTVSTYSASIKTGSVEAGYEEAIGKFKEEMQALWEASKSDWADKAGSGKGNVGEEAEKKSESIKNIIESYSKEYAESSKDLDNLYEREASLVSQIDAINGQIAILESLKLTSPKSLLDPDGGSGRDSSSKEVEEYVVDIDKYREALERLARVRLSKEDLELQLSNTEDLEKRIELQKQLIDVYRSEQEAIKELVELRRDTIAQGVSSLQDMGFKIDYDRESDKFFIRNLELINTLVAENRGEYETMQEATNALREETEALITSLEGLNEENQQSITEWRELGYVVEDTKTNVINDLKQMVTQASDALDTIQNVYDTLKKAADEYAENDGFISLDTYQALIELGPQYMQFLRDENGLLVINEQNIQRVIAARTEQLALESAMAYVEQIKLALQDNSIAKLNNLLYATQEATNATWGLVYAELDLLRITGELNGGQYEAALHNIDAIRSLANSAMAGIGQVAGAAKEEAEKLADELNDMKSGVDDIIKYVMDMLKHRVEQQIDALERMKDAYADIIELKKESLDASKDETDYQDEVAAKIKEIAKLQEKINLLQLDDSRDARAQEAKLMEEMAELQKELGQIQGDYALDAQKESLDKMQEQYEEQKDQEIEALEQTISSEQKLYDMAISYISNNFDTLYQELIAWNTEYGSVLNSEITSAWDNCLAAAQRYGSFVNALNMLPGDIEAAQNAANSNNTNASSNVVVGETNQDHSYSPDDMIVTLIKRMMANSAAWHTSSNKEALAAENQKIGLQDLPALGVEVKYDSHTGQWTMKDTGELLYDWAKRVYAGLFHSGGIVGEIGSVKDNERLAKLENGEVVITKKARESLFSLIDFFSDATKQLKLTGSYFSRDILPKAEIPNLSNITNNQSEAIHFGDVHIYGANEQTVEKHKAVNREFANEVLRHLKARR